MATFFSLDAKRRIGDKNQLMKMSELINWGRIDYKVRRGSKNLEDPQNIVSMIICKGIMKLSLLFMKDKIYTFAKIHRSF
jgi:hypothetical protein